MNLRNRSLLVLGLTFFAFFIIIAAVSLSVTLSGLDRIEYQDMGESMNQTQSALNAESSSLMSTTQDWAWWDDMADFADTHNPEFIERNANPGNMVTVKVHLFMVLDQNGTLLYGRLLSPDFGRNSTIPPGYINTLRSDPRLLSHPPGDSGISGILDSPEGPMIIASAPILHSDMSGPPHGSIIMGRYLRYGPLQRISEMTGYGITFEPVAENGKAEALPAVRELLNGGRTLALVADNESMISGYSVVRELDGKDLLLRITMQRELHRTGFANIVTYVALLALWAVMLGIVVLIVIDRTVLQRIEKLTSHVRLLSDKPEESPLPVLSGHDELAELEKTIMASRTALFLREEQLRVFINAMPGPAALFSREGTILLANPAFAVYLNRSLEDITGSDFRSCVSHDMIEKYDRFVQEAIAKKEAVRFESDIGGQTMLMSYYPILGNDGNVLQLGLLAFDISERKRLENALQKVTRKIALLNTVIFSDIQNKVFVQIGYLELTRQMTSDPKLKNYLEKEEEVVREIQQALKFARQYNDMGAHPPRWQSIQDVMLFAISHLDLGSLKRDFQVAGLEVFADSLLERVFVTLVENTLMHAGGATLIRAGYTLDGDDAVISVEDDGQGIPADRKEGIFEKGLGTGGSGSLFLSREILSITGMTITENGSPGKGARFEIRVPKGSYRLTGK